MKNILVNAQMANISISFIIPAFNEQDFISRCLGSILDGCKGSRIDVQVIVVDNGSTDETASISSGFTGEVYSIGRASVSFARNYGVTKAAHNIIAFIDGDVELTDEWFNTLREAMK